MTPTQSVTGKEKGDGMSNVREELATSIRYLSLSPHDDIPWNMAYKIADFIIQDRNRIMDEIERPLKKDWNPLGDELSFEMFNRRKINEALSTIHRLRGMK